MAAKVLIVEDNSSILIPLTFLLEQNGFEVQTAVDGEEALAAVQRFAPDLVLLDIMLPSLDGYAVCQAIRENPECGEVKIVLLSAKAGEMDVAKGMALGADAFISKPFANAQITATVRRLLADPP
jgi:DNA-binding response OmpR family regulator